MNNKISIKLRMLTMVLVLIGALNWGLTIFNVGIDKLLGHRYVKIVYLLVFLSGLYLAFDRDTYLPFLGNSVFPCGLLKDKKPEGANILVRIKTKPNSKVVYWAAEKDDNDNRGPRKAYGKYENIGVTTSYENGDAILEVKKPSGYNVPFRKLKPHIHYRTCLSNSMFGKVETVVV